ncbi:ubiquitin-conjugating enzyme/RWD-like protein [Mortierella sp. GBAus27b]|nr:ubiquitin-conjugating enzyme/RWD-like protein [Mortierella sp. GBAus27b]
MNTISSAALRKVTFELYSLQDDPPEGIRIILNEDTITDIQAWIQGPEGTPYEGGRFRIKIQLSADFPQSPPKCFFVTKIYHPNVSKQGDVCVSTLKKDWKRDLGLRHILLVVKCLLIVPNPESALNEEAGRQLLERYDDYAKHARLMTSIHAQSGGRDVFSKQPASKAPEASKGESESAGNRSEQEATSSSLSTLRAEVPAFSASRPIGSGSTAVATETCTTENQETFQGSVVDHQTSLSAETTSAETMGSASISMARPTCTQELSSTTPSLKRKWPQEERIADQTLTKHSISSQGTRQTLQGLPTHQNQTPIWTSPTLRPTPGQPKSEPLKDKVHDNTVRTTVGTIVSKDTKSLTESKKRTLRRL